MSKGMTVVVVVAGCILLAVANVALWATLDVFNADRFGEHVAEGMQSDASVEALAGPITDRMLVRYPDFPLVLKAPAEEIVAWMLQRPVFTAVFRETAKGANLAMTTSAEDVVGIDIASVIDNAGSTVTGVVSAVDSEAGSKVQAALETAVETSEESGRLAIYEKGRFPQLRALSNLAPWLAMLAGVVAIVLFVVAYLPAEDQHEALKYSGWGIVITSVLAFVLFVPAIQAVAQNNITDPIMATVVSQVVSSLARGYAIQTVLLFFVGLVLLVVDHQRNKQAKQASSSQAT